MAAVSVKRSVVIYAIANKLEKKCRDFNGIRTHGLCVSAAMLYHLTYEGLYWEQANLLSSSLPWKEWNMKKMLAADTEIQILNEDMIVAVVIAITTCWA